MMSLWRLLFSLVSRRGVEPTCELRLQLLKRLLLHLLADFLRGMTRQDNGPGRDVRNIKPI